MSSSSNTVQVHDLFSRLILFYFTIFFLHHFRSKLSNYSVPRTVIFIYRFSSFQQTITHINLKFIRFQLFTIFNLLRFQEKRLRRKNSRRKFFFCTASETLLFPHINFILKTLFFSRYRLSTIFRVVCSRNLQTVRKHFSLEQRTCSWKEFSLVKSLVNR